MTDLAGAARTSGKRTCRMSAIRVPALIRLRLWRKT